MATRTGRGALGNRLQLADRLLQARMQALLHALDEQTATDLPLWGGGLLSRAQFRTLLAADEPFRQRIVAKLPFLSEREQAALRRELLRVFPAVLPGAVTAAPALPFAPPESESAPDERAVSAVSAGSAGSAAAGLRSRSV